MAIFLFVFETLKNFNNSNNYVIDRVIIAQTNHNEQLCYNLRIKDSWHKCCTKPWAFMPLDHQ